MVFWKSFRVLLRFLVKNAKNNIFEDKCFLSKMFYQIKMQTGLAILKTSNISIFSNDIFFMEFSKIAFFRDF